ncbi:MAG: hypothetical protein EBV16_00210 [Betaproteobacteria bacterium]|jgi:hypothetical protein|nr:hypothetical protein [Pseudomonadota bacterium]NBO02599.1 hypothetical protein [Betaproteobacteria bacterium]HAB48351.1 hypothetical protein [Lautropia sp.]NBP37023.1 hypothetical protein [Betaproteobacteria bacterium]NBQ77631.1 hypothetical protein [Betaproteobacteria bacterium]
MSPRTPLFALVMAIGMTAALIGCTLLEPITGFKHYAPTQAMMALSPKQLSALLGQPAATLKTDSGTRLIFTRGPFGRHSYAVDFNQNEEAIGFEQLLVEARFAKILPGMGPEAVIAMIGPSTIQQGLARQWGSVWSYRFETSQCIWFQIEWDAQMTVRSAGYGIPPECQRRGGFF